jgi:hypothetical protein
MARPVPPTTRAIPALPNNHGCELSKSSPPAAKAPSRTSQPSRRSGANGHVERLVTEALQGERVAGEEQQHVAARQRGQVDAAAALGGPHGPSAPALGVAHVGERPSEVTQGQIQVGVVRAVGRWVHPGHERLALPPHHVVAFGEGLRRAADQIARPRIFVAVGHAARPQRAPDQHLDHAVVADERRGDRRRRDALGQVDRLQPGLGVPARHAVGPAQRRHLEPAAQRGPGARQRRGDAVDRHGDRAAEAGQPRGPPGGPPQLVDGRVGQQLPAVRLAGADHVDHAAARTARYAPVSTDLDARHVVGHLAVTDLAGAGLHHAVAALASARADVEPAHLVAAERAAVEAEVGTHRVEAGRRIAVLQTGDLAVAAAPRARGVARRVGVIGVDAAAAGRQRAGVVAAVAGLGAVDDAVAARQVRAAVAPAGVAVVDVAVVAHLAGIDHAVAAADRHADLAPAQPGQAADLAGGELGDALARRRRPGRHAADVGHAHRAGRAEHAVARGGGGLEAAQRRRHQRQQARAKHHRRASAWIHTAMVARRRPAMIQALPAPRSTARAAQIAGGGASAITQSANS